jgi:hypothetical protein
MAEGLHLLSKFEQPFVLSLSKDGQSPLIRAVRAEPVEA